MVGRTIHYCNRCDYKSDRRWDVERHFLKMHQNLSSSPDNGTSTHLDLTIHIIEGQLETDVFAKDIPIYISRKSCHPPFVFSAVAQSVAMRLRTNCSLDRFLSPRIEEYSRYLIASDYSRKEVEKVMGDCKKLDRLELIKSNKKRRQESRKYVLCSKWDPRQPNIKEGLKLLEDVMYLNSENKKAFPQGFYYLWFQKSEEHRRIYCSF